MERADLRAIVLPYWFVILNANPYAVTAPELGWPDEPNSPAFVEILLASLDLTSRANGDIDLGDWLRRLRILVSKATNLVSLLVRKYSIFIPYGSDELPGHRSGA